MANLGFLAENARILEFEIGQRPADIAERLLQHNPSIVGLGIYIWNVAQSTELVGLLKRIRPDITIILGGPEVSYETDGQAIIGLADYVITGEADLKFAELCGQILGGRPPGAKIIPADLPDFSAIQLPYHLYDQQDLAHRVIYVEASRGCPFECEFCLSSLDIPVRQVALPVFLKELQGMLDRGAKQFKFVDRTFNLSVKTSSAILSFLLERFEPGNFFHFEMIPDRLPEDLQALISRFPAGALQFEIGIQTFNEDVGRAIKRRQVLARVEQNFKFLRTSTGVHIHADLIAGLPGESIESFAAGFDKLVALQPQEIQVGILKRLRGTPIVRHDQEWGMTYAQQPPYEILQNKLIDFPLMQRIRRFARYWDLFANSGNFIDTIPLIWSEANENRSNPKAPIAPSPFREFMRFSDWLFARTGRTDSLSLVMLVERLFEFLTREKSLDPECVAKKLIEDYSREGRKDIPCFLKPFLDSHQFHRPVKPVTRLLPKRQSRHAAASTPLAPTLPPA
jgi:hypothetical protein